MADKKVSELSAITNLSGDDLLLVVNDPSGTPTSNKVTLTNLFANVVPNVVHKGTVTARANTTFSGTTMTVTANLTIDGTNVLDAINDRIQVANAVSNSTFQSTLANTNTRLVQLESASSSNTSTANASLVGSTITFTRADSSTYTLDVSSIQGEVSNAYLTSTFTTNTSFQSYAANTNSWIITTLGTYVSNAYFTANIANYVANTDFQAYIANTNTDLIQNYVANTDFQSYIANTNPRLTNIVATFAANTALNSYIANTNAWINGLDATLVTNTYFGSYFSSYFSNASLDSVGSITFDANEGATVTERKLVWDTDSKTATLGLENDVALQIGQEMHYLVRNQSGSTIGDGTAVYTDGSISIDGDETKLTVAPFIADGSVTEGKFLGLSTQRFDNGLVGYVTAFGYVRGLDTRGTVSNTITDGTETWSGGDALYVHPTATGKLTNQEPANPIKVGFVINVGETDGTVFVRPVVPAPSLVHAKFTVTANGTTGYCFAGSGAANTNNETLYLYKGMTYEFNNTTGASHPFQILNTAGGSAFSNGVSGSQSGVQYFTVPHAQQSNLVYQCSIHSGMQGTLVIVS